MSANCVASCSIGCLFCFQSCNAEKIRVAFTFLPQASSYAVLGPDGKEVSSGKGKIAYVLDALRTFGFYQQAADYADVTFVRTARGEKVPVVWLRTVGASSAEEQPLVLLHCHGNATDLGMMMGPYFELSRQIGMDIVGVEYSGYGVATGTPNDKNTYADVEAAYDHIIAQGVPAEKIIAYGQSVGSGPAAYIASKHQIGGLILHSPMMSGIKVIDPQPDRCCKPSCMFRCFDFYRTDARVKKATSPVFVMHGQVDDIVPFYHGARLSEMTPSKNRWPGYFPPRAGHNDIVDTNPVAYFQAMTNFVRHVAQNSGFDAALVQAKPIQVEMMDTTGRILGARPGETADGNGVAAGHAAEPKVGLEDGFYAGLRREGPAASTGQPSKPAATSVGRPAGPES